MLNHIPNSSMQIGQRSIENYLWCDWTTPFSKMLVIKNTIVYLTIGLVIPKEFELKLQMLHFLLQQHGMITICLLKIIQTSMYLSFGLL